MNMKKRKVATDAVRGRPVKGYFYRRYDVRGVTKHAAIDAPAHADKEIWYCVQLRGWRRSINLHTVSVAIARRRARFAGRIIKLTDEEKFLTNLVRLGHAAEQRRQRLIAARTEDAAKPARRKGGHRD
jgi:hypothetical protein